MLGKNVQGVKFRQMLQIGRTTTSKGEKPLSLRRKQLFRITGLLLLLVLATGTIYGFENRVLEQGMKGSDVMELQRRLAELGYAGRTRWCVWGPN